MKTLNRQHIKEHGCGYSSKFLSIDYYHISDKEPQCPWIFSVMVNSFPPQISHSFLGWPWVRKCFLLWERPLSPCGFSQELVHCSTSWGCTRVRCFSPRQFFRWTCRTVIPLAVSHMALSWCLQPHEYLPPNPLWHVQMSFRGWGWQGSLGQQVLSLDSPWAHLLAGAFSDAPVDRVFLFRTLAFSSLCPSQSVLPFWLFH